MNYLNTNPGKSQHLLTSKGEAFIKTDNTDLRSSASKNLWGVLKYIITKDKLRAIMNAFFLLSSHISC